MKDKGFTLIELMIALFVFVIMSTITVMALTSTFKTREVVRSHSARLSELQLGMALIDRDVNHAYDRTITDNQGNVEPAILYESPTLKFTRIGLSVPLTGIKRSSVQRVSYTLDGTTLIRNTWSELDLLDGIEPTTRNILSNIKNLTWHFLNEDYEYVDAWPEIDAWPEEGGMHIPFAIELKLNITGMGEIRRVYVMPTYEPRVDTP